MMPSSKLFVISAVFIVVSTWIPDSAFAQCTDGFCPLADVQGSKLAGLYSDTGGNLAEFINKIFTFALSIGAMLAILRIALGGYLYMTTDLWSTKERAREVLRETILGLLLLLAVWLILHQINPDILKLDILKSLRENRVSQQSTQSAKGDRETIGGLGTPNSGEICGMKNAPGETFCFPNTGQGCVFECGFSSIATCEAAGYKFSCRQF